MSLNEKYTFIDFKKLFFISFLFMTSYAHFYPFTNFPPHI